MVAIVGVLVQKVPWEESMVVWGEIMLSSLGSKKKGPTYQGVVPGLLNLRAAPECGLWDFLPVQRNITILCNRCTFLKRMNVGTILR